MSKTKFTITITEISENGTGIVQIHEIEAATIEDAIDEIDEHGEIDKREIKERGHTIAAGINAIVTIGRRIQIDP